MARGDKGPRTLSLVEPGDGSEDGARTPRSTSNVMQDGAPVATTQFRYCGNVYSPTAKEVFELPPGAKRRFDNGIAMPVTPAAGTYDVQVTYENDPTWKCRPEDFVHGREVGDVAGAFGATSACTVTTASARVALSRLPGAWRSRASRPTRP